MPENLDLTTIGIVSGIAVVAAVVVYKITNKTKATNTNTNS